MINKNFDLNKILIENRILWHFGFWIFYFFIRLRPYYITVLFYDVLFLKYMLLLEILFFITTYITLFLYNKLVPKNKFLLFFVLGFLVWILFVFCDINLKKTVLSSMPNIANYNKLDMFLDSFAYYILFYFFIILLKYFKQNFIQQIIQNQQREQRIQFELENLKSQIAPHFLFNTMNNFYGLAVEKSNILPDLMIRLSDLLRYSLYETKQEKVALESEIKYIENYIALEKIRLEDNLNLEIIINRENFNTYNIAPLLLINFVENAFKHSKNIQNQAVFIAIFVSVSQNGMMTFNIKNNFTTNFKNSLDSKNSIGLENVQKRLTAIYPNKNHDLKTTIENDIYEVTLKINLN